MMAKQMTAPRQLQDHKVNDCNHQIEVTVMDEPGHGNASHYYRLWSGPSHFGDIRFQNGTVKKSGVNGVTHEALIAILIDRLEGFQTGLYACEENAAALDHLRKAMIALNSRTQKRVDRGVEGTYEV